MQDSILPQVIFSPAKLAIDLCDQLAKRGHDVTLLSPGPVTTRARNITADLSLFETELAGRGDNYLDLLRKHPLTFVTLARQIQSELVAHAYELANTNKLDIVHIYTNEEEIALPFTSLCQKPVVFTHHDPFNFLVRYKNNFPKYRSLNWVSISLAQRHGMPTDTHWVGNVYHGLDDKELYPMSEQSRDYIAYIGRIIQPKGVHLAIKAVQQYNATADHPLTLKIAGKHYASNEKDTYWQHYVVPELNDPHIEYVGFLESSKQKRVFLAPALATIVPSLFEEPFGMVSIESFACGTPVICLDSGALPEVVKHNETGIVVEKQQDESATASLLARAMNDISTIDRTRCRREYESRFTAGRMAQDYETIYFKLHDH